MNIPRREPLLDNYFPEFLAVSRKGDAQGHRDPHVDDLNTVVKSFSIFGSTFCVILNSLLLHFILTTEEFRTLHFFPIGVQATVDLIGPGLINIIYSSFSIINFNKTFLERSGSKYWQKLMLPPDFKRLSQVEAEFACVLIYLRSVLNEYSTGLCVVASAFIRYCLICHPTREILTQRVKIMLSVSVIAVLLIAVSSNLLHMWYGPYINIEERFQIEGRTIFPRMKFVNNCLSFLRRSTRTSLKIVWDALACLG